MSIWSEWKRVTQFFGATRNSILRESILLDSLETDTGYSIKIKDLPKKRYVERGEYILALRDEHLLCCLVLSYSYGIVEEFSKHAIESDNLRNGIESWGTKVLKANGKTWNDVKLG
jgi:hypothetical protein